jgi:hypothetical protein
MLIGSLLVGAALAAVPAVSGAGPALAADGAPPAPSLPVCVSANVGGLDLNQLCKEVAPG